MKQLINIFLLLFLSASCSAQLWFPLEGGLSGTNGSSNKVVSLCNDTINHVLYAAGFFNQCNADTGEISVSNIARWDGTNWSQLVIHHGTFSGIGFGQIITSMVLHGTEIYLSVSNNTDDIYGVMKFNVNTYEFNIVGTFDNSLNALCFYNDTLYAGGEFTQCDTGYFIVGSSPLISGIAKWDGNQWQQVGGGISVGGFSEVNALCVHRNKLYAAGIFETAGGTYCKNIACWNDTAWSAVGSGFGFSGQYDCILYSLASYKNKLFLGGTFHQSDGYISTGLAYWNDTIYKPGGVSADLIHAMKEFNGKLYIGGWEAGMGISPNDRVTCYNDTTWSATGLGPENPVYAMEVFDSSLYVGGEFLHVDSVTFVGYITRFDTALIQDTTGIIEVKQNEGEINVYPNPANEYLTLQLLNNIVPNEIEITNAFGVQSFKFKVSKPTTQINIKNLAAGLYFVKVYLQNGEIHVRKFVKQ